MKLFEKQSSMCKYKDINIGIKKLNFTEKRGMMAVLLHTIHTHTFRTEAISMDSERLLCNMGGVINYLISNDYNKLYSLLRALRESVGSRLFTCIYSLHIIYQQSKTILL